MPEWLWPYVTEQILTQQKERELDSLTTGNPRIDRIVLLSPLGLSLGQYIRPANELLPAWRCPATWFLGLKHFVELFSTMTIPEVRVRSGLTKEKCLELARGFWSECSAVYPKVGRSPMPSIVYAVMQHLSVIGQLDSDFFVELCKYYVHSRLLTLEEQAKARCWMETHWYREIGKLK